MLRFLATSVTVTSGLLLASYWVSAQESSPTNTTVSQPTFTRTAPVPIPNTAPVPLESPLGLPSGFSYGPNLRPGAMGPMTRSVDEATLNQERELSRQTSSLVEKFTQAKEAKDKSEFEKELVKTVTDHFNLRQDVREKELLDLEEQLKRLRKVHDQRTAEKERIVTDRVQLLLRESTGLGWGTDGPQRGGSDLWNSNQFTPGIPVYSTPTYAAPRR